MAVKKKVKKRKASPAQLAALARGRKKLKSAKKPIRKKKTVAKKTRSIVVTKETKIMARKKATKSAPATKKRKRFSGIAGKAKGMLPMVKEVGLAVGGGIAAGVLANKLPIADARMKAAAPVLAGLILATTIGKRNPMLRQVGTGMAVLGAVALIKQFMPNVPMLAGEGYVYLPPPGENAYMGDMLQLGQDDYDEGDYMGDMLQLGDEEDYLSPADM
ncbi:MAG: hypothetical protein WC390_11920 [Sulfurimonas sp.]